MMATLKFRAVFTISHNFYLFSSVDGNCQVSIEAAIV